MLGKVLLRDRPRLAVPTNRKTTLCEKTRSTRYVATTPTCHSREGGAEELGSSWVAAVNLSFLHTTFSARLLNRSW